MFQPEFQICVHDPTHDVWISKSVLDKGYWENDLAEWLNTIMPKMDQVLYIDLGANLGIHGLHAAKVNCTVWVVEPQQKNLHKVQMKAVLVSVRTKDYPVKCL